MTIILCWDLSRCHFPTAADPAVKAAHRNVVFTTPINKLIQRYFYAKRHIIREQISPNILKNQEFSGKYPAQQYPLCNFAKMHVRGGIGLQRERGVEI